MRRVLLGIITGLFIFTACEKEDKYTPEQLSALEHLKGNYHAYIDYKEIFAVVSFTAHYSKPRPMNDEKGNPSFYTHGECYFSDYQYPISEVGYLTCYFAYSKKADAMSFYYKGETNDNTFLRLYSLYIQSEDIFMLTDNGRILTFEKVK
jgi:hypothetical protein